MEILMEVCLLCYFADEVLRRERAGIAWLLNPETGNSRRSAPRLSSREIDTCAAFASFVIFAGFCPLWLLPSMIADFGLQLLLPWSQFSCSLFLLSFLLFLSLLPVSTTCLL